MKPTKLTQADHLPAIRAAHAAATGQWDGSEDDASESLGLSAEQLETYASDASLAEEEAATALVAAERGEWDAAKHHAHRAARIERDYGDSPVWGAFARVVDRAAHAEPLCAIAIVQPLLYDGTGFDWGAARAHDLFVYPSAAVMAAAMEAEFGVVAPVGATLEEIAELVAAGFLRHHGRAEIRTWSGSACELMTDWLPSAGSCDHWGSDVWLGVADRLSYLAFRAAAAAQGYPSADDYGLRPSDADECVDSCGVDAVCDACQYLAEDDPCRIALGVAVSARAAVSLEKFAHPSDPV